MALTVGLQLFRGISQFLRVFLLLCMALINVTLIIPLLAGCLF